MHCRVPVELIGAKEDLVQEMNCAEKGIYPPSVLPAMSGTEISTINAIPVEVKQ